MKVSISRDELVEKLNDLIKKSKGENITNPERIIKKLYANEKKLKEATNNHYLDLGKIEEINLPMFLIYLEDGIWIVSYFKKGNQKSFLPSNITSKLGRNELIYLCKKLKDSEKIPKKLEYILESQKLRLLF